MSTENFSNVEDAVVVGGEDTAAGVNPVAYEIELTDKQFKIITDNAAQQNFLDQELKKIQKHQQEFVIGIAEAKGIPIVGNVELKDKILYISK